MPGPVAGAGEREPLDADHLGAGDRTAAAPFAAPIRAGLAALGRAAAAIRGASTAIGGAATAIRGAATPVARAWRALPVL
ncbi:hypothetical protein, partial [Anaeromyxobacter sp. PSR-1]|uniref:hypothetical protein n=1 Tax=Anaeromyxobacter sp. PSR-1 TaxID=1300915 RepID=UPI00192D0873